jgi:hypothetical protein
VNKDLEAEFREAVLRASDEAKKLSYFSPAFVRELELIGALTYAKKMKPRA